MDYDWRDILSQNSIYFKDDEHMPYGVLQLRTLADLKAFLDTVHIRYCLARPYAEKPDYPVVEARELLPSFDNDMWEYKDLPGFALVAFERQLNNFSEPFQFDALHQPEIQNDVRGAFCPLENQVTTQNILTIAERLPRIIQDAFRKDFSKNDPSDLDNYAKLMPFLLQMDRAHVLSLAPSKTFYLTGVFASFPSDINTELKNFGLRIGKFDFNDNDKYERNRMFVYQYLMELYGFPIVSERRTSSALFARRLHKTGEHFLLRVLGQTDRTITTYISNGESSRYPVVEKTALVSLSPDQKETIQRLEQEDYFLDKKNRVVIIRVTYRQHVFSSTNIRQDRALSVAKQEVLHPLTGIPLNGLNIIKDTSNMLIRLSDIVRGEHTGRVVYKRNEVIENTDTDEKRLKFLYCWLGKHQRRIIAYSDDFFFSVHKIINAYLYAPENDDAFTVLHTLHMEVCARFRYIIQARKVRTLEELCQRHIKGVKIGYNRMLTETAILLKDLSFDLSTYFAPIVDDIITYTEGILADRYLVRTYIDRPEKQLTQNGREIRKHYGRIVALLDDFKTVRKSKTRTLSEKTPDQP